MEENDINVKLLLLRYSGEEISWKERNNNYKRHSHLRAKERRNCLDHDHWLCEPFLEQCLHLKGCPTVDVAY